MVQPGCRAGWSLGQEQLDACGWELDRLALAGGELGHRAVGPFSGERPQEGQEKLSSLFPLRVGKGPPVAGSGPSGLAALTACWLAASATWAPCPDPSSWVGPP